MSAQDTVESAPNWLPEEDINFVRDRVPLIYVEAVPVRLDHLGRVEKVGLLLQAMPDGSISRAVPSGRVMLGETIREALWRNLCKDLGPESDPQLPASPTPFTVVEYFPDPERTGFTDPRHHAVALAYIVPVLGPCTPPDNALDFSWVRPEELETPALEAELAGGHGRLVRMALANTQRLG